jgi:choline dehydrogenase
MAPTTEFDFIVVGAGTAGCVLAARLSEDGDKQVLLLEAGAREHPQAVAVPPAWPMLLGTPADWANKTAPQDGADGLEVPWYRGRLLGGSSAINAMNFLRGHRSSYDRWPEAGAKGWGYDDLLPYFMRSENVSGVPDRDPAVRGMDGPVRVGPAVDPHPVAVAFLDAVAEVGLPTVADLTSGLGAGFGFGDLTIADGRRVDAATAYLDPATDRPNLHIVTDALVHRVTFDGERCTGVEYSVDGAVTTAVPRRS